MKFVLNLKPVWIPNLHASSLARNSEIHIWCEIDYFWNNIHAVICSNVHLSVCDEHSALCSQFGCETLIAYLVHTLRQRTPSERDYHADNMCCNRKWYPIKAYLSHEHIMPVLVANHSPGHDSWSLRTNQHLAPPILCTQWYSYSHPIPYYPTFLVAP